ncbi:hypothetical protein SKAU_G00179760 [Synaphobranchus kaupii]|uniref:Uncharacterized protein n=1 Tax=Synaphobranchus kaupii TaxID=118154 RepID=A0A9Q1FM87_SYNKA|nr:hypothetical protein SKAU_G00179760 [Synaphobranchus kaupii]
MVETRQHMLSRLWQELEECGWGGVRGAGARLRQSAERLDMEKEHRQQEELQEQTGTQHAAPKEENEEQPSTSHPPQKLLKAKREGKYTGAQEVWSLLREKTTQVWSGRTPASKWRHNRKSSWTLPGMLRLAVWSSS